MFIKFLNKLKTDSKSHSLVEAVKQAYILTESVTFSPSAEEMRNFDFFNKLNKTIAELGDKLFSNEYYYNEKYGAPGHEEFTQNVDLMFDKYEAYNDQLNQFQLNVSNGSAKLIFQAMGIWHSLKNQDEQSDIETDSNPFLDAVKGLASGYAMGRANVYEFEQFVNEFESMKHTILHDGSEFSSPMTLDRVEGYISKFRSIIDLCKEYGITTIAWS
jgi:hypothetical protein